MAHPGPEDRAERLYVNAVELPDGARAAFLDAECGGDGELRARVERLLALDRSVPEGFLAGGAPARYLEPGATFAGFRVLGVLGEGGMGTVYAAQQSFPRRDIALKVIRPDRISDDARARFEKEVQALGSLQHPGIAQVYDAGSARRSGAATEEPYLAMELVRGAPIVEYAAQAGLGPRQRMELVARVADALQHAHQRGVVHRDLKPDNVLVAEDETASLAADGSGERLGQPKVLDFGIARLLGANAVETRAGELIGTLAYMSPEQIAGRSAEVDERTDVYALGVLLYQLLTERLPYDLTEHSVPEAVLAMTEGEPRPLASIAPQFRGDVTTIVAHALDRDPGQRYASAAALAEDLRRHLRGEPILARSHSSLYVLQRALRRHRVGASFAAGLVAVVAVFGVLLRDRSSEVSALTAQRNVELERTLDSLQLLRNVADGLGEESGPNAQQRRLLEAVLASHTALLEEHADEATVGAAVANTRYEVSKIQLALGDDHAAREAASKTIEDLLAVQESGVDTADGVATVRLHLANVLIELGDLKRARREAERALERFEAAGSDGEGARALSLLAEVARKSGKLATARELAEAAVERAAAIEPAEGAAVELRLACLNELAVVTARTDGWSAAVEVYERLLEELESDAVGIDRRPLVAGVGINLGRLYHEAGRPDDAERVLARAVEACEELVRAFPEVEHRGEQLLVALNNLGALFGMQARPEDAGRCLGRGLELVETLLAANPSSPSLLRYRNTLLTNVGNHLASHGDVQEGCELMEIARANWKDHLAREPGDRDALDTLVITLAELGFARLAEGEVHAVPAILADFPAYTDANMVGRMLSVGSMTVERARGDGTLSATEAEALVARCAHEASELLGRCYEAGYRDLDTLRTFPHFAALRGEAEFAELLDLL